MVSFVRVFSNLGFGHNMVYLLILFFKENQTGLFNSKNRTNYRNILIQIYKDSVAVNAYHRVHDKDY